jgi:predicted membrane protein
VLWLLKNLGIITTVDLSTALRLWPLYLIMIGIDALTGRRSRRLNALAGTIGALIVLAVIAYSSVLGIESTSRQRTETVSAPIGAAESADVVLEFGRADVRVFALDDSDSLIDASISHQGTLQFEEGNPEAEQRTVRLATEEQGGFSFFDWFGDNSGRRWEIGLTPMVTLELDVEGGVGDATLALQDLDLMHLDIEGGIGELQLSLPDTDNGYSAQVTGGIGDIEIAIPDGATVERLNVSIGIGDVSMSIGENTQVDALVAGGVGDFTLEVPEDAAVRVVADTDMGDMDLPDEFRPVERGVWETSGFAGAARQIMVEFDGDIGDLDVDTR